MSLYLKYVKRHNYVFNKDSNKRFLSKNPLFMPKLKSLKENRNLKKTLNKNGTKIRSQNKDKVKLITKM